MKKNFKTILIAILLVVSMLLFSSCATQVDVRNKLKRTWDNDEQNLIYRVFQLDEIEIDGVKTKVRGAEIGEMLFNIVYYNEKQLITIGEIAINDVGHYANYIINIEKDGIKLNIESKVFFAYQPYYEPICSYKEIKENEKTIFKLESKYYKKMNTTYCDYSFFNGTSTSNKTIKLKGSFYDNEMIFSIMRMWPFDTADKLSLNFGVISPLDDSLALTSTKISRQDDEEIGYFENSNITMKSAKVLVYGAGSNTNSNMLKAYFAGGFVEKNNLTEIHLPVVINQNNIEYVLSSYSI